jgi:UDP-N-acetylglucosamine 2-epimerase (non-hydrolysing)/GDP/UDP-N,N'-diacetylbacillosamine 2-epimerase (hydrolysing)
MRKICVITGTRAEYGLLSHLMRLIADDCDLKLQIIATNMHLSPEFGFTYREIEADGFTIDKKVQMLLSADTANATVKSVGLATIGFADAYEDLKPDMLLVLGDRYEILAAVASALIYKIPVAHLHGGETTEGAYDEAIRHAITKMSHLHFTSTEEYRQRVIQLGESPERVFYSGAIGVDNILNTKLLSKEELERSMNFSLGNKSLMVTFHPATLENATAKEQCQNLLTVLSRYEDYKIIFTLPNSDTDGRIIMQLIDAYLHLHKEQAIAFASLGSMRYLSALQHVTAVVGNSSSGIVEVPSFGIPTLNIGNRQRGRIRAQSIIDCGTTVDELSKGMERLLALETLQMAKNVKNPYHKKNTAQEIFHIIKNYPLDSLIQKTFYNLK